VDTLNAVVITAAAVGAGTINAVVGSGTLITFPALVALGYPPLVANVSNNIGLVPGGLSATWGYRSLLAGQSRLIRALVPMAVLGGLVGALLLLWLPSEVFDAVVPVLILVALVLVIAQPRLNAWVAARRERAAGSGRAAMQGGAGSDGATPGASSDGATPDVTSDDEHRRLLPASRSIVLGVSFYGGYFGAAQGVLMMGLLGVLRPESLQQLNGLKNFLVTVTNAVAAVTFLLVSRQYADSAVIALIAVGSFAGGLLGSRIGRWLPAPVLRGVIVVVGLIAVVRLLLT